MNIHTKSVFVNADGRTVKIESIEGSGKKAVVKYRLDGGEILVKEKFSLFKSMLESGGYRDITDLLSSFHLNGNSPRVGNSKVHGDYRAEVTHITKDGIQVKFSDTRIKNSSTTYLYAKERFNLDSIFTPELVDELSNKFKANVFEVIVGERESSAKFTVVGRAIDKDLLDKIKKAKGDVDVFSIKRLTSINIQ